MVSLHVKQKIVNPNPELKLKGIKLNISKWQRPPQNSSPWESKAAGLYMICTLSKHQAEKDGYTDSLMLDHEGNIAEATSANIFFKDKNNELHTPIPDSFLECIYLYALDLVHKTPGPTPAY